MHDIITQNKMQINHKSQYVRSSWMVELTGITTIKNENVFDHVNHLADLADNFTLEQKDIAHSKYKNKCSNYNSIS